MKFKQGFTLLEILLVIAAISILTTIVLIAINPIRQLAQVRDTSRAADINSIQKAIEQYSIDSESYPDQIYKGSYRPICSEVNTTNCFDPSVLIPTYISDIPVDPSGNGYLVGIHPENDRISVWADQAELREVVINKFASTSFNLTSGDKDPSIETAIDDGFDGDVNSIASQTDGKIVVGGSFTQYRRGEANYIVRLNSDGSRDTGFNIGSGFNDYVWSVVLQDDGKVLVGGDFTIYNGVETNGIVRLNSDGSVDNSFDTGAGFVYGVWNLAIQSNNKILAVGDFISYDNVPINRIIRLDSDGSIDSSFNVGDGFDWDATTLAIQDDGKIIVGGAFTSYQGSQANSIIRLNPDGGRDNSFDMGSGFNDWVWTLAIQDDGKILVGGDFWNYRGLSSDYLIRLNSDGTVDPTFNTAAGFDNYVYSVVIQDDGKIIVGGEFTTYQSLSANHIIRLNANGSRDESFNIGSGFLSLYIDEPFWGEISEVAIYNRGLTSSEVQQNFNATKSRFGFGGSPSNIVQSGLLSYLDASNVNSYSGSGNIWNDISGNNNNATLYNSIPFNNSNGGSFSFDGENDLAIVKLPSDQVIASVSYSAWVKPTVDNSDLGYSTIIDFGGNDSFWMGTYYGEFVSYSPSFDSGNYLNPNTWYHVSISYSNGGPMYFYINGNLVYTSSSTSGYAEVYDNFAIGAGYENYGGYVNVIRLQGDGQILAGGNFAYYKNQPASNLTRIIK